MSAILVTACDTCSTSRVCVCVCVCVCVSVCLCVRAHKTITNYSSRGGRGFDENSRKAMCFGGGVSRRVPWTHKSQSPPTTQSAYCRSQAPAPLSWRVPQISVSGDTGAQHTFIGAP